MDATAQRILICLWGDFRIVVGTDVPVDVGSRKARACLALLACSHGMSLSRERLAGMLWGNRSEEQARANLRQLLYELKPLSQPGVAVIGFDRQSVWLEPGCEADTAVMLRQPVAQLVATLPERGVVLLADLDGVSEEFDDWLAAKRAEVETSLRRCVQKRMQEALAGGDFTAARMLADAWTLRDATDETIAQLGLRADAALGDGAGIQQRMKHLGTALAVELGIKPAAATLALARDLASSVMFDGVVQQGAVAPVATITPDENERAPRNPPSARRQRWKIAAFAAALLIGVGFGAWRATTTRSSEPGEAAALAARARALTHGRTNAGYAQAAALARKAIARDPDYAPGWAELAAATWFLCPAGTQIDGALAQVHAEVDRYLNRALTLDPRLGRAIAVRGLMLEGAAAGSALEQAVAVAPDDAEAWLWLGSWRSDAGMEREALAAYRRAAEIDPLWDRSVGAYVTFSEWMGERQEADQALERFAAASPNPYVVAGLRAQLALARGDLVGAAQQGTMALTLAPQDPCIQMLEIADVARAFGETNPIRHLTAHYPRMRETVAPLLEPQNVVARVEPAPEAWLEGCVYCNDDARELLRAGRADLLLTAIEGQAGKPFDIARRFSGNDTALAALYIVALRRSGRLEDANRVLTEIRVRLDNQVPHDFSFNLETALALALEEHPAEAVANLDRALARGWRGQSSHWAVDPADEPAFAGLLGREDFKRVRGRLAEEREHLRPQIAAILANVAAPVVAGSGPDDR